MVKRHYISIFALALACWTFNGCGHEHSHDDSHDHTEHDHSHDDNSHDGHDHSNEKTTVRSETAHGYGSEYTAAYVCPMHCKGSGSTTEGKCPECGMDYVKFSDHISDKHHHRE